MNVLARTLTSTIGLKFLMAVSGLAMVGFLCAHLAGNLLIFAGPEALNSYAEGLRKFPVILLFLRVGLVGAVILHIFSSVKLIRKNNQARTNPYMARKWQSTRLAARSMALTGCVILAFVLYHLAHLTWRLTHPEFAALGHFDVYQMMLLSFQSPLLTGFYVLSVSLLMLHLSHGVTSFFQTIGLRTEGMAPYFKLMGPGLAILLGAGFISIPVAVLFGLVS